MCDLSNPTGEWHGDELFNGKLCSMLVRLNCSIVRGDCYVQRAAIAVLLFVNEAYKPHHYHPMNLQCHIVAYQAVDFTYFVYIRFNQRLKYCMLLTK